MSRWNIATIFFLGMSGRRQELTFEPGRLNIITGASGTGKSALIKAIDYCLGSSKCELPVHIRRRALAVGIKWISGDKQMIVGRLIPPDGQTTSTQMFATAGSNLPLPATPEAFDGATTIDSAKAFLERAFGIGDLYPQHDATGKSVKGRTSVRHVTPYLFVTKEVIDSESVLLHGLERPDKARDIIASMPYFLGVTDQESALAERRLRQLQRGLDQAEARERSKNATQTALKQRAIGLLTEAHRIGLAVAPTSDVAEVDLLTQLQALTQTTLEATSYPSESELGALHSQRRDILSRLVIARRRLRETRTALTDASGFEGAVTRQHGKLMLAEHLQLKDGAHLCPLCEAPSDRGRQTATALAETLTKIRAESVAVERVIPKLVEHDETLVKEISDLNDELRVVDEQIKSWLRQTDETRRLADIAQARAHFLGRVSFFLEASTDEPRQLSSDLSVLRSQIEQLEAKVDREAKEIKLRRAETKISQYASEAFKALPTVAPCVGSELYFSSREPEMRVIEANNNAVLRMPDVGSDQNYLAIHIALAFALQRYFGETNAPVPGFLVLDQISRPYFPTRNADVDEKEISGGEEDEDIQAMRRHINFLFSQVEVLTGLQVLLIEHAYFADDPRYVTATRERWTRASGKALIPLDWPMRGRAQS
jgi:energy-coupling factor transporter ATP-binding protein EcfA2